MNWTINNRKQIQELIDTVSRFESGIASGQFPQPDSRRLNALPVMEDSGGVSVVCPDGSWKCVLWERPQELTEMACFDDRIERGLRFAATQKYPVLRWLIPERQPDSIDCPECGGDGKSAAAKKGATNVVCWCGGLGWIPANESYH